MADSKNMGLNNKHIDFIPGKYFPNVDAKYICVFSHKYNDRHYKKKAWVIGVIFLHPKTKMYAFYGTDDMCIGYEGLDIIAKMLNALDKGNIVFKPETGELYVK